MMDLTFDSQPPGIAYGYLPRVARLILRVGYKLRVVEAALDVVLIAAAYFGAFLIRLDFPISQSLADSLVIKPSLGGVATYPAFLMAGVYRGMWRYAGTGRRGPLREWSFGRRYLCIDHLVVCTLASERLHDTAVRHPALQSSGRKPHVISPVTQGDRPFVRPHHPDADHRCGSLGAAAGKDLGDGHDRQVCLLGFVDDDAFKHGKLVAGYPVLGSLDDLDRIYWDTPFNQILIAAEHLHDQRLDLVWNFASRHNVAVRQFSLAAPAVRNYATPQGVDGPLATAGG